MNADFHDTVCHGDAGDQSNQPRVDTGVHYAMTCLNELLTKMKSTTHGASSLLDQSLVLVTSDTAWGKIHTNAEWPVLLAGKAGGKLQGDAHYNFPGENLSKALLTVSQLMGSTATSLAAAREPWAPLTGINRRGQVSPARPRTSEHFQISPRPVNGETKWGCEALSHSPIRNPSAPARSKSS